MKLNSSNLDLLPDLLDEIHDRYFSLDDITYDKNILEWMLFFGESRKGPFERLLRISGVTDYICNDPEKIVIYDMNKLTVDLARNLITLECNVPLDIKLHIRPDFEIYVG